MLKRFSLHKIWFFYNDDYYYSRGLAESVAIFETITEAENEKKKLDRIAFRNIGGSMRELTSFYEDNYEDTAKKIIEYFKSQNWNIILENPEKSIFESENISSYMSFVIPQDATDAQIDKVFELTGADFCKIIEFKDVKEDVYVKVNYDFWGKKVFDKLKLKGVLDSRSPYFSGISNKGFYLISKPPKGRKSAKFTSSDEAKSSSVKIFLESISEFPDNNFIGKTYVEDWSDESQILLAYLENCTSIKLVSQEITKDNIKICTSKLRKMKSNITLVMGMNYYEVHFNSFEETKITEVNGLFELLKLKPFQIFNQISEINGQEIRGYVSQSNTF